MRGKAVVSTVPYLSDTVVSGTDSVQQEVPNPVSKPSRVMSRPVSNEGQHSP